MEAMTYFLKVNIAFAALFAVYALTMRRETGFNGRRAWLLMAPLAALSIPFLHASRSAAIIPPSVELPVLTIVQPTLSGEGPHWNERLILLHVLVTGVLLIALGVRTARTVQRLRRCNSEPGSFFGWIHVPAGSPPADHATILAHERAHARQLHSVDVILYEVLAAMCWSIPLWRIALREVRLVHEHIADRLANSTHPDYPTLLIAHSLRTSTNTLHHAFSRSTLKTRITMLYNERPTRHTRLKLLLAAPALLLAAGLVSWRIVPPMEPAPEAIVYVGDDTPAEFPGGMPALLQHLSEHVRYPEKAITDQVEGTVHVSFNVKANGEVADVTVKRGVRSDIDTEAVRVVSGLPSWKPATSKGKAVNSTMTLPIAFALPKKK